MSSDTGADASRFELTQLTSRSFKPKNQEAKQSRLEGDHHQEGDQNANFVIQDPL